MARTLRQSRSGKLVALTLLLLVLSVEHRPARADYYGPCPVVVYGAMDYWGRKFVGWVPRTSYFSNDYAGWLADEWGYKINVSFSIPYTDCLRAHHGFYVYRVQVWIVMDQYGNIVGP